MADGSDFPARPVEIVLAPEPFTTRVERLEAQEGATIAHILTEACKLEVLDPQDLCRTEIYLDGERLLDRAVALDLQPAPGQLLNVVVLPQGGGGHNKVLSTVLEVAMIAATAWIAGPAPLGAFSLAGASGLQGVALAAVRVAALAAVTIGGSALLQQLNKPETPTQQYDLETQSNEARKWQPMPLCLGQRRYAFDLASSAISSFTATDTYITAIYALHYGPCTLTDIKIGETLITAFSETGDIQTEMFLEPGPRNSQLYPTNIHQDSYQNQLDRDHDVATHDGQTWGDTTVETCALDTVTVELDFYWPSGLFFPKTDGSNVSADTYIYVEVSPYSQNQWTGANGSGGLANGVLKISANSKAAVRFTTGINLPSQGQYDIRVSRNYRPTTDVDNDTVVWTALRSIKTGEPILDPNLSILVIKAKAGQDFSGSLGVVSGVVTPRVPILGTDGLWKGDPTTYDAVNWQPSSNAIELLRYMMTGYPAAKPLLASEIDGSLATQRALIEAQSWDASVLVTGNDSQQDVVKKLGAAGRFQTYWNGSALCVTPDWIKPAPLQMFVGRNASGFRRTRNYPDPIHAFYVTFTNEDEDWKDDGLYVYNDGYDATNATLIETMQLDFACTADRAHREGRVGLARRIDGVFAYEWTAFADGVVATLGDRVRARRTSALYDQSDARVSNRVWSGSLVAGVRLDVEFEMTAGESYAMDVRSPNQLLTGLALQSATGLQRVVMFAAPLEATAAPQKGDLVAIGRVNHVTEDVEIIDIDPQSDRTVSIKARNYIGPSIQTAETGPIPPINTFLTARTSVPAPRILGTTGSPAGAVVDFEVAAQRTVTIAGFSARWRQTPAAGQTTSWNALPSLGATARTLTTPAVTGAQNADGNSDGEVSVDVEITTVASTGESSTPAQAYGIVLIQPAPAVTNFTATGVTRTASDGSAYPALAVSATPRTAGDVQDLVVEMSADGTNWVSAGQPLPAANPVGDFTSVLGGSTISVQARWRTVDGWVGPWATINGVAIPAGVTATNSNQVGGQTGPQLLASTNARVATLEQNVQDLFTGQNGIGEAITDAQNATTEASAALAAANEAIDFDPNDLALAGLYGVLENEQQRTTSQIIQQFADKTAVAGLLAIVNGEGQRTVAQSTMQTATDSASKLDILGVFDVAQGAVVLDGAKVLLTPDESIAQRFSSVSATLNANAAAVVAEQIARATAVDAVSSTVVALTATVGTNTSAINAEQIARANGDSASAALITSLTATVGGATSAINTESVTRAANDSALSATITSLTSTVNGNTAAITVESVTRSTSDQSLAGQVTTLNTQFGQNSAAITAEAGARATADTAISATVTTLTSNLNGVSATVTAQAATLVNLQGRTEAFLKQTVTAGGSTAIVQLYADGFGSSVLLDGDYLFLGSNVDVETATGTQHYYGGSAQFCIGEAFGANGDLLAWSGPASTATAAMTRANAYFYISTNASVGGSGLPTGSSGAGAKTAAASLSCNSGGGACGALSFTAPSSGVVTISMVFPGSANIQAAGGYEFYIDGTACGGGTWSTAAGGGGSAWEMTWTGPTTSGGVTVSAGTVNVSCAASSNTSATVTANGGSITASFLPTIN